MLRNSYNLYRYFVVFLLYALLNAICIEFGTNFPVVVVVVAACWVGLPPGLAGLVRRGHLYGQRTNKSLKTQLTFALQQA